MTAPAPPPPTDTKKPKSKKKKSAAPPPPTGKTSSQSSVASGEISFSSGPREHGERIVIYGSGGMGKSSLAASLVDVGIEPLFIDLDEGTLGMDVARATIDNDLVRDYASVRATLKSKSLRDFGAVVVDSGTTLQDACAEWVIENVPHEKDGVVIQRLEDYGYGKGLSHVYDAFHLVLQDLDALARKGMKVILICHQTVTRIPSADTEDFISYHLALQQPPKTGQIQERVASWCDFGFRIDRDKTVKDGKASTGDIRCIHTNPQTVAWAKQRILQNGGELPVAIPYKKGSSELWKLMFGE